MELGGFDIDKKAADIKKLVDDLVSATSMHLILTPGMDEKTKKNMELLSSALREVGAYSQEQTNALNSLAAMNAKLKNACLVQQQLLNGPSGSN